MKSIIPIFLTILIIVSCKEKNVTSLDLANQIVKKYENKKSLSYDINYRVKYLSQMNDTTQVNAKIDLIRQKSDSLIGGYIWIKSDSIERYYDTRNTYFIDHRNQSITRYPKEKTFVITGNTTGDAIKIYFLKPDKLSNEATDTTINIKINDQSINDKKHWKLSYKIEDDEYIKNVWRNIWIEKENFFIKKMNFSADMQGENQYNQWDLLNMSYNNVTISDLEKRFELVKQKYTLEDYKEKSKIERSLLSKGTKVPELNGTRYSDRSAISLSDYQGKIVLLDFWYMDCFPCIKAIPHLNEMQSKYKDQGLVVIGANSTDDYEKNIKRMPNFLSNNPIDYEFMFIDKTKPKDFKIYAYPSFYLIDKQGKIIHSQVGYSEESILNIDSLIQINL